MKAYAEARGWATDVLSPDAFYDARSDCETPAQSLHPRLRTRGVPGKHKIELMLSVLAAMPHASHKLPVAHPRFDKAATRALRPRAGRASRGSRSW